MCQTLKILDSKALSLCGKDQDIRDKFKAVHQGWPDSRMTDVGIQGAPCFSNEARSHNLGTNSPYSQSPTISCDGTNIFLKNYDMFKSLMKKGHSCEYHEGALSWPRDGFGPRWTVDISRGAVGAEAGEFLLSQGEQHQKTATDKIPEITEVLGS